MYTVFSFMPQQGGSADPMGQLTSTMIMFGSIIVIFYFMMIRPQQKRQRELKKMLDEMQKGDRVVTSSGIHGTIAEFDDESKTITLNVADNTKMKFDRASIATVVRKN